MSLKNVVASLDLRSIVSFLDTKSDRLPGGRADGMSPDQFDPGELSRGTKHEMEHTNDPAKAKEIAMDHLVEDPKYYTHLRSIEHFEQAPKNTK